MNYNYGQNQNMNQFNMNMNMNNTGNQNSYGGLQNSIMSQGVPNPNCFVNGRIGNIEIVNEDLPTFMNNIKSTEWTQNSTYKSAKNISITTSCGNSRNNNQNNNILTNNFNNYLVSFPSILSEFPNYENEINQRRIKLETDEQNNKTNFLEKNLQGTNIDIDLNQLYFKIGENRNYILSKDQILYKKIEKLLPQLNKNNITQPPINNQQEIKPPQPIYNMQPQQPNNFYGNNNNNNMFAPNTIYNNMGSAPCPAPYINNQRGNFPANFNQKF